MTGDGSYSRSGAPGTWRYTGGNACYLEVLTNDTNLYNTRLGLADTEQQEALSLVQL